MKTIATIAVEIELDDGETVEQFAQDLDNLINGIDSSNGCRSNIFYMYRHKAKVIPVCTTTKNNGGL